eukprot:TRINITY_DN4643_c0_g2_i1.p1 TRINITY_DN4643_c0_g2~~TRINITY_DN4643_c0_g2_i1.p1  ORF type:complete len:119 (+),score=3.45 TRINITY_DN4643_c0_g2_i1:945-1301(+)
MQGLECRRRCGRGAAAAIHWTMDERYVKAALSRPLAMVGQRRLVPRYPPYSRCGCFPRVLGRYSREAKLFSLPAAFQKVVVYMIVKAYNNAQDQTALTQKAQRSLSSTWSPRLRNTYT